MKRNQARHAAMSALLAIRRHARHVQHNPKTNVYAHMEAIALLVGIGLKKLQ